MSLGRLTNSLISVTNENTVALVNAKVELSLFRCEPLAEFLPVGQALTPSRRKEAETGNIHQTASILGFLFNDTLPDTPALTKAFGNRVSEILSHPDINPQGTTDHGPFQPFIGADGTSIWAAATSGDASIGVLLLACLLANNFDSKVAIATWVELIDERKTHIQSQREKRKMMNPHTLVAAECEISREGIARWDASVRSWLRRADLFMRRQKTQFALIAENLMVPQPTGKSVLENVSIVWRQAMEVMEGLLTNISQDVDDRAILLGIPAWHLYPDLLVLRDGNKKVEFKDPQIPSSAVLTLGTEYKQRSSGGHVRWSLALSHLRFYGDPVPVRSKEGLSRVPFSQLWLFALGVLYRQWDIRVSDMARASEWFAHLGDKLRSVSADGLPELSWLLKLCSAASSIGHGYEEMALRLVKYGWRRGTNFLGTDGLNVCTPFFGLCNPVTAKALHQTSARECGVDFIRQHLSLLKWTPDSAVISSQGRIMACTYTEWATIAPIALPHDVRADPAAEPITAPITKHARWIRVHHPPSHPGFERAIVERRRVIEQKGEAFFLAENDCDSPTEVPLSRPPEYVWKNPPGEFCPGDQAGHPVSFKLAEGSCLTISEWTIWLRSGVTPTRPLRYALVPAIEDILPSEQWDPSLNSTPADRLKEYMLTFMHSQPIQVSGHTVFREAPDTNEIRPTKRTRLGPSRTERGYAATDSWLGNDYSEPEAVSVDDTRSMGTGYSMMMNHIPRPLQWLTGLRLLEVANQIYNSIPMAYVASRVVEQPLTGAKWQPSATSEGETGPLHRGGSVQNAFSRLARTSVETLTKSMNQSQILSCVAMFESGHFNIEPDKLAEVIALCSEDSIFVAGILLTDPGADSSEVPLHYLVGNIGHSGMALLVSPLNPRIRKASCNPDSIDHKVYDYQPFDAFGGTSLHLSFTKWKMPLEWENTGEIDQELFLLESVVSVRDDGRWVADIDVLSIERDRPDAIQFPCDCPRSQREGSLDIVSIDSWDELLDLPPCVGVIRARDNWVARLAAASIIAQQGDAHAIAIVEGRRLCLTCLVESYTAPRTPQVLIY